MPPTLDEVEDAVRRLELSHGGCVVKMPFQMALSLIAHVQLALRHPGAGGASGKMMRTFCADLIATLEVIEPALGTLLRAGFDPAQDVPFTDPNDSVQPPGGPTHP